MIPFLTRILINENMNIRFVAVGITLGVLVAVAVFIGSPAIDGLDALR